MLICFNFRKLVLILANERSQLLLHLVFLVQKSSILPLLPYALTGSIAFRICTFAFNRHGQRSRKIIIRWAMTIFFIKLIELIESPNRILSLISFPTKLIQPVSSSNLGTARYCSWVIKVRLSFVWRLLKLLKRPLFLKLGLLSHFVVKFFPILTESVESLDAWSIPYQG